MPGFLKNTGELIYMHTHTFSVVICDIGHYCFGAATHVLHLQLSMMGDHLSPSEVDLKTINHA